MNNQEDILANFQQITAIEDIAVAIAHLESTGWDLEAAVHLTLDSNENKFNEDMSTDAIIVDDEPGPSTSSETKSLLFNVNFNNVNHKILITDNKTINDLKQLIMQKTSVPVCRQLIKGLSAPGSSQKENSNANASLRSLQLPQENHLELTDLTNEGFASDVVLVSSQSEPIYQLRIKYTNEDRMINLNFPGSKTLLDIKNDLYAVLKIPVRFQKWIGWPENATNSMKLCELGIDQTHSLQLTRTNNENQPSVKNMISVEIDSDSDSVDEFEDALNADEDIFTESASVPRLKYLIDDRIEDEILGCLQFVSNYRDRYVHGPNFFEGSLEDAMKTACCPKSVKDRKLLAIYLHHDQSVLSNVFCGQLLGNENIIKQINDNYIIYGWDFTCESNKNMFLSSLTACVNDSASLQIRSLAVNQFPLIVIIRKFRSVCEIADVIQGNINGDELYIHLMMNLDAFNEQLQIEIREENERAARENLIKEQQQAYEESLLADRAKEKEKLRMERYIESERQKQETERMQVEAEKEAVRINAENSLPPEPTGSDQPITKIRFRKPTGEFFERKFTADTKLKILLNFATANGFTPKEFKIICSFPRRDLTLESPDATLQTLKLVPQETLILEER